MMSKVNDDDQTTSAVPPEPSPEPSYVALFPNLDKVSRSSFEKGTLSRRRIRIAAIVLVIAFFAIVAVIVASVIFS